MNNPEIIFKFAITMISILNPLGIIPTFLSLTDNRSNDEIRSISNACSIAVMSTMAISLFFGQAILNFFGISLASFTVGGGLLIFSMSFSMLSAKQSNAKINREEMESYGSTAEIGIVPLAIPLLSGPGTISTCIIWGDSFKGNYLYWAGALAVVAILGLIVKLILSFSRKIGKRLGRIGLSVMSRIMGLILLALSIEMIIRGLKQILPFLNLKV